MRVVIIGAGEVGFDVARTLSLEQHDVVVVDTDPTVLEQVAQRLDVLTVQGSGTSIHTLEAAGIREADMLIAVTAIDEVNLIACMIADRLGVPTTVARVRSDVLGRAESVLQASELGIDLLIHPEESTAAEIVRLIRRAGATDVLNFCDGRLQLVGMRLDPGAPVLGRSLRELAAELAPLRFRVMAISRGFRTILPHGDERLQRNDQIFVLARPDEIPVIARAMGKLEAPIQRIMILGGTKVGAQVARQLGDEKNRQIKLIEPDREQAEQLAEELEHVLVLHGDVTDIDLLVSEGLGEMDAFVAVTDDEESNLVTCLMAKHLGVRKTVALLSKTAYVPISQAIGLDAAVSQKLAVSREILRFLRGRHVLSVATVYGLNAEILEIEAKPRAPIVRKPLKALKLPRGVLIGALLRNGQVEIATGDTQIQEGDRAIVFVTPDQLAEVERLFDNR
ncbi:Trk system potassium transporter TrkA [Rhodothermus marinus]|uniref:Trk system potassium transporter TrkA n=1 Tax=Rhodothermus marinus TaxID=29549 RepID=UPI0012BA4DEB|nr:Trk system potassium transporter TrkA [Rhodothermus marinus]BBM68919.1 Trk system potassium transport protein TrkA [Rhodothermus marinus]BBM71897.1 Trk system potassium transport protein TrkA [Rhodothermus marinus]